MPAGELAALGTATAWTGSSLAFEAAARRIGSLSLNFLRVVLALGWLTLVATIASGHAIPTDLTSTQWGYLLASGVVGLVLGDLCTFRAYLEVGAQRTMVFATATPIFTAALAWLALGETVSWLEAAGMLVIGGGVMLAIRDRVPSRQPVVGAHPIRGLLLALGGSLGQAGGLLLSKHGLGGSSSMTSAIAATQIRVVAGVVGFAIVLTAARWWPKVGAAVKDGRAVALTATGALLGPGIGVTLSLYAVTHASAGVASALMSLTPILILPVVVARGDRIGLAGVAGAVLAVTGAIVLALA